MGITLFSLAGLVLLLLYGVLFFQTSKRVSLLVFLALFIFTNPLLSVFSSLLGKKIYFNFFQGFDFAFIFVISFLVLIYNKRKITNHICSFSGKYTFHLLVLIFIFYILYGIYNNGFLNASIYLRMLLYPILLIFFGFSLSEKLEKSDLYKIFFFFFFMVSSYLMLEIFAPYYLYNLLDVESYYFYKSGYEYKNIDEFLLSREKRFLNLKYFQDLQIFKPAGPTFNYPSTSYIVVLFLTLSLAVNSVVLCFIATLTLMLLGTKAGLLSAFILILSWILYRLEKPLKSKGLIALGLIYSLFSLWFLFLDKSIHAYSLISSIFNLMQFPFGQGIGFGGSMTVERVVTYQFDMLVGDSGVAIVLNMFGVCGLILYFFYFKYLSSMISLSLANKSQTLYMTAVFGFITLFNSLSQELAIGPYGIGMALFLCAFYSSHQLQKDLVQ